MNRNTHFSLLCTLALAGGLGLSGPSRAARPEPPPKPPVLAPKPPEPPKKPPKPLPPKPKPPEPPKPPVLTPPKPRPPEPPKPPVLLPKPLPLPPVPEPPATKPLEPLPPVPLPPKPPIRPPVPQGQVAMGIIRQVGAASVTLGREHGQETLTFGVNDKTQIHRNGQPARLADLKPEDQAHVLYVRLDGKLLALRIAAQALGRVRGTLSTVDGINKSVTITPEGGSPVTLRVDDKTKVVIDGKPGSLDDLSALVGKPAGAIYDRSVTPPVARLVIVITRELPRPAAS